jgi:hypothetical protein
LNLGEEIIDRYKDTWFVESSGSFTYNGSEAVEVVRYIQLARFDTKGIFEAVLVNWDLLRLELRMVSETRVFSRMSVVEDQKLINDLNEAKRKMIVKKLLRKNERVIHNL